jgi:hypothetical protein
MPFITFPVVGPYAPAQLTTDLNTNFTDAQNQINTKAPVAGPTFTGLVTAPDVSVTNGMTATRVTSDLYVLEQLAPTSKSVAATLTAAEVLVGIIQYTGAADNLTLPTGTELEVAFTPALAVNGSFDVSVINTGSGAATLLVNTDVTNVGSLVVTNGTSGRFRFRKTATNTFVVYRVS